MRKKQPITQIKHILRDLSWIDYIDEINAIIAKNPKMSNKDRILLSNYNGLILNH